MFGMFVTRVRRTYVFVGVVGLGKLAGDTDASQRVGGPIDDTRTLPGDLGDYNTDFKMKQSRWGAFLKRLRWSEMAWGEWGWQWTS
jgi:hypothetical protein